MFFNVAMLANLKYAQHKQHRTFAMTMAKFLHPASSHRC